MSSPVAVAPLPPADPHAMSRTPSTPISPVAFFLLCIVVSPHSRAAAAPAVVSCNRCSAQPSPFPGRIRAGCTLHKSRRRDVSTSDDTFRLLYEVAVATSGLLEPERLAR